MSHTPEVGVGAPGWGDGQLGARQMKGAQSFTDVLIKNS